MSKVMSMSFDPKIICTPVSVAYDKNGEVDLEKSSKSYHNFLYEMKEGAAGRDMIWDISKTSSANGVAFAFVNRKKDEMYIYKIRTIIHGLQGGRAHWENKFVEQERPLVILEPFTIKKSWYDYLDAAGYNPRKPLQSTQALRCPPSFLRG